MSNGFLYLLSLSAMKKHSWYTIVLMLPYISILVSLFRLVIHTFFHLDSSVWPQTDSDTDILYTLRINLAESVSYIIFSQSDYEVEIQTRDDAFHVFYLNQSLIGTLIMLYNIWSNIQLLSDLDTNASWLNIASGFMT